MKLITYTPLQTLNKAFRKEKVSRSDFNKFKAELQTLLKKINEEESEEHLKYPLRDFLKNTFYANYEINTKGKTDLGIYLDNTDKSKLGVIIETKKPSNVGDMITQTDINKKAMHEAILYYLRERIDENNNEIKHIVITNLYEWFIFDAHSFERLFFKSTLNKEYGKWKAGQKTSGNTPLFYNEIARPFIDECDKEITATYFDLRNYQKGLDSENTEAEKKLTALYKIFSGVTLIKEAFANDSNSLDKKFYNELLHIIGLEETKKGSKKTIKRKAIPDNGSLIENAIATLETNEKLHKVDNKERYGETKQDMLFNVALELVITWVNRILFLKLLEAQLVKYHQGNKDYKFLDSRFIGDYDELNELFFEVLAKRENERNDYIKEKFKNIPYLNSSLFEFKQGSLEDNTILISNLKDRFKLPVYSQTVLRNNGKKISGELSTLKYFFDFLEAYDFSSEGAEEIQEENKSLINASVLGLIFEKINGYKDGSFYTPGFITMYMCRETISRAILQKFKEAKGWDCETIEQLKDKIENRAEANSIINKLKICDPAVGSGHFLVSALNEIITVKSELDILSYRNGSRIKNYKVEVSNDELIITDKESEDIFEYRLNEKGKPVDYLQELQEALFHEKETIIEDCLFGVDINPNSVNICRLRLWIELLKNAYYTKDSGYATLETLPNIDINIKCGNSIISRFPLDADLSKALKTIKYNINTYRKCVLDYKNATNKDDKRSLEVLIDQIKNDFRAEIHKNDPKYIRLNKTKGELWSLTNQTLMFEQNPEQKQEFNKKVEKLTSELSKLELEITDIQNNILYRNAFEWRFEFPEVLDDEGNFLGFDVVIGNPPYIRQEELGEFKTYFQANYPSHAGTADIYVYFIDLGTRVLVESGNFTFIVPNKWMRAGYGKNLRNNVIKQNIKFIIDFGDLPVFEEATTYPCIISFSNIVADNSFYASNIETLNYPTGITAYIDETKVLINKSGLQESGWSLNDPKVHKLLSKLRNSGIPLDEYVDGKIFYGLKTGLNEAFVINADTRTRLIKEDSNSDEIIKPFLAGRDVKRYKQPTVDKYLILFKSGQTKSLFGYLDEKSAWLKVNNEYPAICNYLLQFEKKSKARYDKGQYWWELRACDYYDEFEKPKIIYPNICKQPEFTFDESKVYTNQKCFIISCSDLYLLGVLNSKITFYLFKMILPKLRGDFFEPSYLYFKDFPIALASSDLKEKIISLVRQIMELKKQDNKVDTSQLEVEIDHLIYELYGLTEEEIKLIELS
ncbi:MAG: Eco57I restriction-modification methylase domain-containing protein [Bacteroidales bacterium]